MCGRNVLITWQKNKHPRTKCTCRYATFPALRGLRWSVPPSLKRKYVRSLFLYLLAASRLPVHFEYPWSTVSKEVGRSVRNRVWAKHWIWIVVWHKKVQIDINENFHDIPFWVGQIFLSTCLLPSLASLFLAHSSLCHLHLYQISSWVS